MFQELMPLLGQRILLLTLSRVSDEQICVNVIPKPLKSDQQDDGAALTTPLSVTGTPRELDEQLPRQLVEFVETHLGLSSTLKSAKEQMEAAAKAARKRPRNPQTRSLIADPARVPWDAPNPVPIIVTTVPMGPSGGAKLVMLGVTVNFPTTAQSPFIQIFTGPVVVSGTMATISVLLHAATRKLGSLPSLASSGNTHSDLDKFSFYETTQRPIRMG
jgi:PRTRC genetic system protein E